MSKEGEVQGERAKKEESVKKREREKGTSSGQCGCIAFSFHGGIEAKKARRYRGYAMWNRDDRAHYNVPSYRARTSLAKVRVHLLLGNSWHC